MGISAVKWKPYFPSKEKLCNVVNSTPWHISFASVDISAKNCFNVLFQKLKTNGETKICKYWICIGGKPCVIFHLQKKSRATHLVLFYFVLFYHKEAILIHAQLLSL